MAYQIEITPEARPILLETAAWYQERAGEPPVADRWLVGFLHEIQSLSQGIEKSTPVLESDKLNTSLRQITYGSGRKKTSPSDLQNSR